MLWASPSSEVRAGSRPPPKHLPSPYAPPSRFAVPSSPNRSSGASTAPPPPLPSPSYLRPWSWPLLVPLLDVLYPLTQRTINAGAERPFDNMRAGWLLAGGGVLCPLSPIFYAAWWWYDECPEEPLDSASSSIPTNPTNRGPARDVDLVPRRPSPPSPVLSLDPAFVDVCGLFSSSSSSLLVPSYLDAMSPSTASAPPLSPSTYHVSRHRVVDRRGGGGRSFINHLHYEFYQSTLAAGTRLRQAAEQRPAELSVVAAAATQAEARDIQQQPSQPSQEPEQQLAPDVSAPPPASVSSLLHTARRRRRRGGGLSLVRQLAFETSSQPSSFDNDSGGGSSDGEYETSEDDEGDGQAPRRKPPPPFVLAPLGTVGADLEHYPLWPWERWFSLPTRRKEQRASEPSGAGAGSQSSSPFPVDGGGAQSNPSAEHVVASNEGSADDVLPYDEHQCATPQWQRFYTVAARRLEFGANKINGSKSGKGDSEQDNISNVAKGTKGGKKKVRPSKSDAKDSNKAEKKLNATAAAFKAFFTQGFKRRDSKTEQRCEEQDEKETVEPLLTQDDTMAPAGVERSSFVDDEQLQRADSSCSESSGNDDSDVGDEVVLHELDDDDDDFRGWLPLPKGSCEAAVFSEMPAEAQCEAPVSSPMNNKTAIPSSTDQLPPPVSPESPKSTTKKSTTKNSPPDFDLPPTSDWPHRPLYCRFVPTSEAHPAIPPALPLNRFGQPGFTPFETDLFRGSLSLSVADLSGSEMQGLFDGKKRRYRYVVKGVFKKDLPFSSVYTGQIIRPCEGGAGNRWLMKSMRWMMKSLSPAMKEGVDPDTGDSVVLSPVAATAQRIKIRRHGLPIFGEDGCDVGDDGFEIAEDCRLLGKDYCAKASSWAYYGTEAAATTLPPLGAEQRKKKMCLDSELAKHTFFSEEKGFEYTFEFYQHLFDPVSFHMNVVGVSTLDVAAILGKQPVRIMAKVWDPNSSGATLTAAGKREEKKPSASLWDVEMWHCRTFDT